MIYIIYHINILIFNFNTINQHIIKIDKFIIYIYIYSIYYTRDDRVGHSSLDVNPPRI